MAGGKNSPLYIQTFAFDSKHTTISRIVLLYGIAGKNSIANEHSRHIVVKIA